MTHPGPGVLVEFPADDPERARRFWEGVLGVSLRPRREGEGEGWQTGEAALGLHARAAGPGDRVSLPYFSVADLPAALESVVELGGAVIHPGERWAICRDSEGSPFGLGPQPASVVSGMDPRAPGAAAAARPPRRRSDAGV